MIVLDNVGKRFDDLTVLEGLDLRVDQGEIVGIVGPSGTGKTTILKLLTGIVEPDEGRVTVPEGPLAYVFQEPRLLPWRTALDNVAVVLRAKGMGKSAARTEATGWLERVGLKGFENYHPEELSGGMAQRVAIARALAVQPRVLLLDEPFSNMDTALEIALMDLLQMIIEGNSMTVVLVTHDLTEALRLADRIVELTPEGRLRDLDVSDRLALAEEWLSAKIRPRS